MRCTVRANCHQHFTSMLRPSHYRRGLASVDTPDKPSFRRAADARNHKLVFEFLARSGCVDCGESDVLVLQFDHLDNKSDDISWLVGSGCSPSRLARELAKCEIRCQTATDARLQRRGDGFAAAATSHLGLLGIRERAEMLGGRLRIRSDPGGGTSITVGMPAADVRRASG